MAGPIQHGRLPSISTFIEIDMSSHDGSARYPSVSITLHWLMFLLMVATYALIEFRVIFEKGSDPRETMKSIHFMLGLSIFFLVWLRICARVFFRRAKATDIAMPVQRYAASAMHLVLYAFMIAMPLLGWLTLSAGGKVIPFFGLELPALISPDAGLKKELQNLHEQIGEIGYYLIGLHAAAALAHHYLLKNQTLRNMLPWRGRSA